MSPAPRPSHRWPRRANKKTVPQRDGVCPWSHPSLRCRSTSSCAINGATRATLLGLAVARAIVPGRISRRRWDCRSEGVLASRWSSRSHHARPSLQPHAARLLVLIIALRRQPSWRCCYLRLYGVRPVGASGEVAVTNHISYVTRRKKNHGQSIRPWPAIVVGPSGIEPETSAMSRQRSNHLSYDPTKNLPGAATTLPPRDLV